MNEMLRDANWGMHKPESLGVGSYWEMFDPGTGLFIYGKGLDSDFPEDMPYIENSRKGGYIFGWWMSVACVRGELGSNHVNRCIPITKEMFDKAVASGGVLYELDDDYEGEE